VLNKTDGVIEANVNFATEKVTIEYDNEKLDLDKIEKIIKSIGYELIT
jgi:Cu+-exporting ATPase